MSQPIGVTSSNVIQIGKDGAILANGVASFRSRRSGQKQLLPVTEVNQLAGVDIRTRLDEDTILLPRTSIGWFWAPGTANVYRRAILERVRRIGPVSPPSSYAADTLFLGMSHCLAGTALIDRPLSAYRIHDDNDGSDGVGLSGLRMQRRAAAERSIEQRRRMCASLIEGFCQHGGLICQSEFWSALDHSLRTRPAPTSNHFTHAITWDVLVRSFEVLVARFGELKVLKELDRRMPSSALWRLTRVARTGRSRLSIRWALISMKLKSIFAFREFE